MALKLQELQAREAITNPDGTPSRYFLQYLRSRGGALTDIEAELLNAVELLQSKVDKTTQVIAGTGLTGGGALSGNVTLNVSINDALNTLSTTHGSVLYRGAGGWSALPPGTLGNVLTTGGSGADPTWGAIPSSTADIQVLLDGISATQGTILYRSSTGWSPLAPGTSGQFLKTNGSGANPSWGTVTTSIQTDLDSISSTRGTILYRGASGWTSLTPGTSGHVLQTNGSGADPSWAAPSGSTNIQTLLDGISSTRGTILFRGASAWQALSPGTSGYVLQTKGAGLDPAWEPDAYGAGGGGIRPSIVQSASSAGNSGGVTFSVAPTPGNLLVCVGTHYNNISATGVSAGWTIMNNRNGWSTDGNFIGTKIATSADTASISVYGNVSGCCMTIFEIQNSSGVMFLPWNDIQEQTGLTTTTLNMGIPRDNCLLVGAVATVSANTAPTSISGATAGTTVTGTSSSASPRQVTPFTNNSISKGAANVVATYAASPRSYGFGVVVLPV